MTNFLQQHIGIHIVKCPLHIYKSSNFTSKKAFVNVTEKRNQSVRTGFVRPKTKLKWRKYAVPFNKSANPEVHNFSNILKMQDMSDIARTPPSCGLGMNTTRDFVHSSGKMPIWNNSSKISVSRLMEFIERAFRIL